MACAKQPGTSVSKELTDLIECTICLETPPQSSYIYQCENGHLYCGECRRKSATYGYNCGFCVKPLGNSRSLIAEKLLPILKEECQQGY